MRYLLWDFDGTLGFRDGGAWTAALLETLNLAMPGHAVTLEQLRLYTHTGYPWHLHDQPHPHLTSAEMWWGALHPVLMKAYRGVGLDESVAWALAHQFRAVYLNPNRWRLFDDVLPVLDVLSSGGWMHAILSNHVPELGDIVQHLGLTSRIAFLFNSAETGYEKPHPRAFQIALEKLPDAETVWMIGDNFTADVQGAEAVGLPAILVRRHHSQTRYFCETLHGIELIVSSW